MTEHPSIITRKGQVTIPAEIRRALNLKEGDAVIWRRDGEVVRLVPARFTLESAFASVTPHQRPEDFEAVEKAAKRDKASATLEELSDQTESSPAP